MTLTFWICKFSRWNDTLNIYETIATHVYFFKKGVLLQLKFGVVGAFTCGHGNLTSMSCILLRFVLHAASNQNSHKFKTDCKYIFRILRLQYYLVGTISFYMYLPLTCYACYFFRQVY